METKIKETEAKTYTYILSVVIGTLIPDVIIVIYKFCYDLSEYLTYHNAADDNGGKLTHYVDLKEIQICGILSLVFIFVMMVLVRTYAKKLQIIGDKKVPMIISVVIMIISAIVLGYISIIVTDIFITHNS